MPTPAEIHEQVELEREQIRQGSSLLHTNTCNLEEKQYASASVYGVAAVDQLIPLVAARITATNIIFAVIGMVGLFSTAIIWQRANRITTKYYQGRK